MDQRVSSERADPFFFACATFVLLARNELLPNASGVDHAQKRGAVVRLVSTRRAIVAVA
jgi:hypothetical protein